MTLLELCEPLFLYYCRLNRSARKHSTTDGGRVRGDVAALLEDMRARAAADPHLADQFSRIEMVLMFFIDGMVRTSALGFARQWKGLAEERRELAGDEKFFDLLEETLAEQGKAADERLAVFYLCMGLGFTGWYSDQPQYIRSKMLACSNRMRSIMDADDTARICPEAYQHTDTSNLVEPPGQKLVGIGIALVGLIIAVFVTNFLMFMWGSRELAEALRTIIAGAGS
ncbi:MAG: DotU family type IV/VI secretion system protein [Planctomycetes bacterium]|nr:DotU family type IV/VI secretion system protein [Planctomycetota bacterium]